MNREDALIELTLISRGLEDSRERYKKYYKLNTVLVVVMAILFCLHVYTGNKFGIVISAASACAYVHFATFYKSAINEGALLITFINKDIERVREYYETERESI